MKITIAKIAGIFLTAIAVSAGVNFIHTPHIYAMKHCAENAQAEPKNEIWNRIVSGAEKAFDNSGARGTSLQMSHDKAERLAGFFKSL